MSRAPQPEILYAESDRPSEVTPADAAAPVAATGAAVPGGAGFRVRGVDDHGVAVDPTQRGAFEPLRAHPSFDVW